MATQKRTLSRTHKEKGQSLVEIAMFLPIFLVIIAGMVEISQLVVNQNIVTDAARASTRFGANGGEDAGMVSIILNSVPTPTINLSEEVWDIWTIRATINGDSSGFDRWDFTHVYGVTQTVDAQTINPIAIQQNILDELQIDHEGNTLAGIADSLEIIGTYIIYDVESILGLDAVPQLSGLHSITELNVTRVNGLNITQSNGCTAFPLAISSGIRSVYVDGGINTFRNSGEFEYPSMATNYYTAFVNNPDTPTDYSSASEGTMFEVSLGFPISADHGLGKFGWLKWNIPVGGGDDNILSNSLTWPGDSADYTAHGDLGDPGSQEHFPGVVIRGYVKPGDTTDISLHTGDWIQPSSAQLPAIETAVQANIDAGRELRMVVWPNPDTNPPGVFGTYMIQEFAVFKIHGYGNSSGAEWLLLEFIRKDNSCGQQSAPGS